MHKFKTLLLSMTLACPLHQSQMVNLHVPYFGLDNNQHVGILVVNKDLSDEVQQIFMRLDKAQFPIAKIKPLSDYSNEDAAMTDNDTFAYSCRYIAKSTIVSKHSFGIAIDLNPVFNPYVRGNIVIPANGRSYINRNISQPGMVINSDVVVQAFAHFGWRWGGNWRSLKDYQHFEKSVP